MEKETYRRCPECGAMTKNSDHCKNCGALINTNLRRKIEREERAAQKQEKQKQKKPNAITSFFEKTRNHQNPVIRVIAKVFYSIWMVFFLIGGFLAYLIGFIAA